MEKELVCNPTKQLEDYPKEVIIKAFYRSIVFFNTDKFVAECEIIHAEIQFQKLMERAEELSKQTKILLTNEPQKGDWERLAVWIDEIKKINKEQDRIQIKIDELLDYKYAKPPHMRAVAGAWRLRPDDAATRKCHAPITQGQTQI